MLLNHPTACLASGRKQTPHTSTRPEAGSPDARWAHKHNGPRRARPRAGCPGPPPCKAGIKDRAQAQRQGPSPRGPWRRRRGTCVHSSATHSDAEPRRRILGSSHVKATHSEVCSQVPPSLQWHSCQQVPCCAGLAHGTGGAVSSLPRRAARACIAGLHGAPRTTAHTQLLPISDGQCSADQSSMLWLGHAARGWAGGAAHGDRAPRALDAVAGERDRAVAARPARPTPLTAAHEQLCVACRVFTRTMCQAAPRSALAQQPRLCSRPTRAKSRGHILPGRGAPVALAVAQAVSAAGAVLRAVVQTGGGARHGEVVREPVDVHGIVDGSAPQPLPASGSAVLLPSAHRSAACLCRILPVALPPPSCGVRPSIPFFSALAGQHAVMLLEIQQFTCSLQRLHNPLQAAPKLCTVTHMPLRVTHVPSRLDPCHGSAASRARRWAPHLAAGLARAAWLPSRSSRVKAAVANTQTAGLQARARARRRACVSWERQSTISYVVLCSCSTCFSVYTSLLGWSPCGRHAARRQPASSRRRRTRPAVADWPGRLSGLPSGSMNGAVRKGWRQLSRASAHSPRFRDAGETGEAVGGARACSSSSAGRETDHWP